MPGAIRFQQHGGPEVLQWEEVEVPAPGPKEATVKHHAVGLNFIDVYHRTGLYGVPLPSGIGYEGSGVVTAVGNEVTEVQVGDRVAYVAGPLGAYSEVRNIAAGRLVKLPESINFQTGAAMMLKGLTVAMLLLRAYRVQPGDKVLIHAAAGGIGLIACQWAKALGATVIGTVGSEEKAAVARKHGCDHTILYRSEDFVQRVRELTEGKGVAVVYDGVGNDTFLKSLDCLQSRGTMVVFGNASGPVPPFDVRLLGAKGSLFLTRPSLFDYIAKREDLEALFTQMVEVISSGKVAIPVSQTFPLRDAAAAHEALEGRSTTGATVLLP
eukprot:GGOE01036264.1.p1 GENE.GGOE01036264.1~~GGOE01036264.1.p1  ORF type:complete len:336 (+),score=91.56 GGOE01036264.1:35-1009(+)